MPKSKKQNLRFEVIENLLKKKRGYTVEELCEQVNAKLKNKIDNTITARTVYNDLIDLEEIYKIKIIKEAGSKRRYANSNDSFKKPIVEKEDEQILSLGLEQLSGLKHLSFFNKFSDVVNRLLAGNIYQNIEEEGKSRIIQIGESYNDNGYNFINEIYQAIKNKKVIRVLYNKGIINKKYRNISPYILKEYRNQWYMVGYSKDSDRGPSSSVYNLSKIETLEQLEQETYIIDPQFKAEEYFKYSLGIFHDLYKAPIVVKLKFTGAYWVQHFKHFKLHSTMEIISCTEDEIVVGIEVYNQIELKSLILDYNVAVEVLEPIELRKEIQTILKNILLIYQKPKKKKVPNTY
jgi:predicted DNA-binding transcriptional regulator YafY